MNPVIERIYKGIKNLSKAQRKIIYISAVVLISLLIFWIFVYGPQSRKFAKIKLKLTQAENQIAEILRLTAGKDLVVAVTELRTNLTKVTAELPAEDEDVIYNLSENAKKLKIEVRNMAPSGRRLLANKIPNYDIEELPISMNLVCEYRVLGEYLNILRNSFPVLIRVRQLDIKGKGEGRTDLDVTLQVSAYLAHEKK